MRLLALLVVVCGATVVCARDNSLRCGTHLVLLGAQPPEVLETCGPPVDVARHVETYAREVFPDQFVFEQVLVEEWTYDPGPHSFVRDLVFRNGILSNVKLGSYGSR